jgi:RHS repeat-associated protein
MDGLGRRVARRVNGEFDRAWLYQDALRPIAEIDSDGTFSQFIYTDAAESAPDFILRGGVPLRVVKDYLGSVRLVVNAQSGEIAQELEYDEFGNVTNDTTPGFQPFGFAGGLYDPDTHLVRFGARDYDAITGRWVAKDPLGFGGGDTNLYAYCHGDPVNLVDQNGKNPVAIAIILIGLSIAGDEEHPGAGSEELFTLGISELGGPAAFRWIKAKFFAPGGKLLLRFAQKTASQSFSAGGKFAGKTIANVADELQAGLLSPSDVPVEYVTIEGNNLIVNTRSAVALMRAKVPQTAWRLIDATADEFGNIRSRLLKNGLPSEGTDTIRVTGLGKDASSL